MVERSCEPCPTECSSPRRGCLAGSASRWGRAPASAERTQRQQPCSGPSLHPPHRPRPRRRRRHRPAEASFRSAPGERIAWVRITADETSSPGRGMETHNKNNNNDHNNIYLCELLLLEDFLHRAFLLFGLPLVHLEAFLHGAHRGGAQEQDQQQREDPLRQDLVQERTLAPRRETVLLALPQQRRHHHSHASVPRGRRQSSGAP
eukprot:scaffold48_cov311-Pinguiococcus_pyrenoidosus.AAC.134